MTSERRNADRNRVRSQIMESALPLEQGGKIRVKYQILFFPGVHKIQITATPFPAIRECTPVTQWYIRSRNDRYRRTYGPVVEYRKKDQQLVLTGESTIRGDQQEAADMLKKTLDRKLAHDYPKMLDIYFGIVPAGVRKKLMEEMDAYAKELEGAD